MTAVTVTICSNCSDYADVFVRHSDAGSCRIDVLKPHGTGWRHLSNNSVRCPGQEGDDTDDRAIPETVPADTEGSASRQHFIDTGYYLPITEAATATGTPDGLSKILDDIKAWEDDRESISEDESNGIYNSDRWHDSDDTAVELLRTLAAAVGAK